MAVATDPGPIFFTKATPEQWSYVLSQYKEVLKERASKRTKKGGPEELIRLDTWYQEQLPKIIHSRKPPHIVHEELIQIVKWKLMRGKFRPRLIDLVRINTETAVLQVSKKAFRRPPRDLSHAISGLTNLKGVGPATASAILAAAFPDDVPYMADESMLSTPGIEATDYTLAEYLNYAEHIKACSDRLKEKDPKGNWNPHKVELTLWTHYLAQEMKPEILDGLPPPKTEEEEAAAAVNNAKENGEHDVTAENGNNENHSTPTPDVMTPPKEDMDDTSNDVDKDDTSNDVDKELPIEENTNDSNADSGKENVSDSLDSAENEEVAFKKDDSAVSEKSPPDEPPNKKLKVEQ